MLKQKKKEEEDKDEEGRGGAREGGIRHAAQRGGRQMSPEMLKKLQGGQKANINDTPPKSAPPRPFGPMTGGGRPAAPPSENKGKMTKKVKETPRGQIVEEATGFGTRSNTRAETGRPPKMPTVSPTTPRPTTRVEAPPAGDVETAPTTLAAAPTPVPAATYEASVIDPKDVPQVKAAQGKLSKRAIAKFKEQELSERAVAAERDLKAEQEALAEAAEYEISDGAYVDKVTGEVAEVAPTQEAEVAQRKAILGRAAEDAEAAQILETLNYEAAQVRAVKGTAAKGAAAEMIAEVGELPPELSATIVEDPQTVEAQIDDEPVEVQAAVAALPTEALVSSQMETLLAGIEDGEVPTWARASGRASRKDVGSKRLVGVHSRP